MKLIFSNILKQPVNLCTLVHSGLILSSFSHLLFPPGTSPVQMISVFFHKGPFIHSFHTFSFSPFTVRKKDMCVGVSECLFVTDVELEVVWCKNFDNKEAREAKRSVHTNFLAPRYNLILSFVPFNVEKSLRGRKRAKLS